MITVTDRMVTKLKRTLILGFVFIGVLNVVTISVLVYALTHGGLK